MSNNENNNGYVMATPFCIPPGETLSEWMEDNAVKVPELADRLGMTRQSLYRILKGDQPITAKTALHLELVTKLPASFWMNLEKDYREALLRRNLAEEAEKKKEWLEKFQVKELECRGVLPAGKTPPERMSNLLGFFGVSSPSAFDNIWKKQERRFAARSTKGSVSDQESLLTWLQLGTLEAKKVECGSYDPTEFRAALEQIRGRTPVLDDADAEGVKQFLMGVKTSCANVGVTVVFLKPIKGMRKENGVAFWIDGNKRPVILMTLNNQKLDRILFSFYHEAHHILSGKKDLIYVSAGEKTKEEKDADEFAAEMLIPSVENVNILSTRGKRASLSDIAHRLGVGLFVVVGRYLHLINRFGTRYRFPSISWKQLNAWKV